MPTPTHVADRGKRARSQPLHMLDRDLSWLEFNRRVLHEAIDDRTPLLERVNFLAIFTSNLDEFVMKRVYGLREQVRAGVERSERYQATSAERLATARRLMQEMQLEQAEVYGEVDTAGPRARGNSPARMGGPDRPGTRRGARRSFESRIFPVLTPLVRGRRASVSVHLQPVAVARPVGPRPQVGRAVVRARESAGLAAAVGAHRDAGLRGRVALRPPGRADPRARRPPVPGDGDRRHDAVPRHPQHRGGRRRGRRRGPARGRRAAAAAAADGVRRPPGSAALEHGPTWFAFCWRNSISARTTCTRCRAAGVRAACARSRACPSPAFTTSPGRRSFRHGCAAATGASSTSFEPATCWCTTRTTPSTSRCCVSSARPWTTRRCRRSR